MDFINMPDGSFFDPDGYYFNKEGFDKHGGYYDEDNKYFPGPGNKDILEKYGEEEDPFENDELLKQFEEGEDDDDYKHKFDIIDPHVKTDT